MSFAFAELIYPSSEATILHNTTAKVSNEKPASYPIARISKKIDFLLCNSCFWCATNNFIALKVQYITLV
jgi:hypothetical protein